MVICEVFIITLRQSKTLSFKSVSSKTTRIFIVLNNLQSVTKTLRGLHKAQLIKIPLWYYYCVLLTCLSWSCFRIFVTGCSYFLIKKDSYSSTGFLTENLFWTCLNLRWTSIEHLFKSLVRTIVKSRVRTFFEPRLRTSSDTRVRASRLWTNLYKLNFEILSIEFFFCLTLRRMYTSKCKVTF